MYYLVHFLWFSDMGEAGLNGPNSGHLKELKSRCHLGQQSAEGLTGAGGSAFKVTHKVGRSVLAVGRSRFLVTWTSPHCCLSVLTTWRLASSRVSGPRAQRGAQCL